jgi:hypothetical protein
VLILYLQNRTQQDGDQFNNREFKKKKTTYRPQYKDMCQISKIYQPGFLLFVIIDLDSSVVWNSKGHNAGLVSFLAAALSTQVSLLGVRPVGKSNETQISWNIQAIDSRLRPDHQARVVQCMSQ